MDALSERYAVQELALNYELYANQNSMWKAHLLENAELVSDKEDTEKSSADEQKNGKQPIHR